MSEVNKLMVMAGGTGGHVFPALAVANALREKNTHVTWLGTRRGLEATVIPANNIDIEWVTVEGLRGKGILSWLLAPFKLVRAMWQSMSAIRRVQPDCILGMGGFVAGPGGLVARLLGKSLVIHEQNAVAGLTNHYLAKIASKVLTGFPNTEGLPKDAEWVGNPVRAEIQPTAERHAGNQINVLVIGGSQGAHSFNQHLAAVFAQQSSAIEIRHQAGRGRAEEVRNSYQDQKLEADISEFIEDMASAYEWADLLICRAGAMTIAECCAAAKPALLIPYPFSAGDHQEKNAQAMVAVGAAVMLDNSLCGSAEMVAELTKLLTDPQKLESMGKAALSLHKPDALQNVVSACEVYLNA